MSLEKARNPTQGLGSIALVALAALALRAAVSVAIGFNPAFFDADGYHAIAMEGLAGRPLPTDGHPPGYSWLLLAIYRFAGPRPRIVYAVQIVLSAAVVFLVGDAARRRFGPRAGVLASLLVATSGILAIYPSLLVSENLCLLGVSLIAWLLLPPFPKISAARLSACAAIVAILALTRTAMLLLALPLVAIPALEAIRLRRSRDVALAGLAFAVATAPLLAYSSLRAGRTGVFRVGSPADVYSFYLGNNPNATGRAEGFPDVPQPGTTEAPDMEAVARILGPKASTYLVTHLLREGELFVRRASFNFAPNKRDLIYLYGQGLAGERTPWVLKSAYVWVAIGIPVLGAAVPLALARDPRDGALRMALLLVLAGVLPYHISIGDARYLIPFHPLLAFAAGALLAPFAPGQWSARTRLAAGLVAIAFFGNAAYDVWATDGALRKVTRPGGAQLHPPYILAR